MDTKTPGFFARIGLALKVLFSGLFAARLLLEQNEKPVEALPERSLSSEKEPGQTVPDSGPGALHLLSLLQREGRFVDFLQEDVASFSDAEVGAAARVVHQGCRKSIEQYFTLETLRPEEEGSPIRVEAGFDPGAIRLTGQVRGEAPFSGTLAHPGWRAVEVRLPSRGENVDPSIVAPAEVEL